MTYLLFWKIPVKFHPNLRNNALKTHLKVIFQNPVLSCGLRCCSCVGAGIWGPVCVLRRFIWVRLFVTLWTVARQAPLSMGLPRQDYWSRLPFPSPGDLPNPGIKPTSPTSPALQANSLLLSQGGRPWLRTLQVLTIEQRHCDDYYWF